MAQVDIGDAALDYAEAGAGPAVLLIHGSASDARTWNAQFDELAPMHERNAVVFNEAVSGFIARYG